MSTIVTRAGKGSPLTHNEVDANFTNLNTDKIESGNTVASLIITSADINGGTVDNATIGGSTPAAGTFTTLTANSTSQFGKSSANYIQADGAATTLNPIISIAGSDTNVSMVLKPQGTGALDIAAGSKGVNISNGGTVTALTRTASGSGYTSLPSIAITAPTTAGGVQATASPLMGLAAGPTIVSGGTGYTVNDVLTISGSTGTAGQLTVNSVSAGVITGVTVSLSGNMSAIPTNPASVTGGTGSGATFTLTYSVSSSVGTITNAGSGYVEQPTVTFSGGGGSGAAAYATVGGTSKITGIGAQTDFYTPSGPILSVLDGGLASTGAYLQFTNSSATNSINRVIGSGTNLGIYWLSKGTGSHSFTTNNSTATEQFRVSHTASAVNYVQVTGAATGSRPIISAQGSDSNISLGYDAKGTGGHNFKANGNTQVLINNTTLAVNSLNLTGSATGQAVPISVTGTDTNIDLALTPKGTGIVKVTAGNGLGYGTGTGGAVTQATSRTTGVTLDKPNGAITLVSAAGTTTWQTFTVTNNTVAATDTVIVSQKSGADLYQIFVTNVAAGSFKISYATTGGTTTEQPVFNFAVIKAVVS